ncbi:MAG: NAD(P)H-hydrate dehydratase [Dictyoglomaceae bacterium]|nr:NAD(P)H-hydrate dehydratase [Dictyoglomaceae bacterium]
MRVISIEETRELEKNIVEKFNIPPLFLMENAGSFIYYFLKDRFKDLKNIKIAILCGPGNNGGDALVVARYLYINGNIPIVLTYSWENGLSSLCQIQYEILKDSKIKFLSLKENWEVIKEVDLIIDGIFGIGLKKPLDENLKEIIKVINNLNKNLVSIDVPTGIDANTGDILGESIKANTTITMFFPKIGFFNLNAMDYIGELIVNSLGFPYSFLEKFLSSKIFLVEEKEVKNLIPSFSLGVHKGNKGKVLIIGGSIQYTGAPILSARASLRTACGMVYLALPESISNIHRSLNPELIFIPLKDEMGYISEDNIPFILDKIEKLGINAVGIGPGIGLSETTQRFVRTLSLKISIPLVIDADGLTAIKPILSLLNKGNIILTPHVGEMSRLLDISLEELQRNRFRISQDFSNKYNINLILKGPYSLSSFPNSEIYINPFASPLLATAGSGDVLTGIIVSLLAQGLEIDKACILGNYIHSLSALIFKEKYGERGLIAGDIIENIPLAYSLLAKLY